VLCWERGYQYKNRKVCKSEQNKSKKEKTPKVRKSIFLFSLSMQANTNFQCKDCDKNEMKQKDS